MSNDTTVRADALQSRHFAVRSRKIRHLYLSCTVPQLSLRVRSFRLVHSF